MGDVAAKSNDVHSVAGQALDAIGAVGTLAELAAIRSQYLGRGDGHLTLFRRQIGNIENLDSRKQMGKAINELVVRIEQALAERQEALESSDLQARGTESEIDLTWPPPRLNRGYLHPVTRCEIEIREIFTQLGYLTVGGPEVEYDHYNFTLVNMPPGHPSRATQDTFYIDENRLLRTQNSPVQVRAMVAMGAPLKVIVPGKAYRRDWDATHFPMFFQVEGLCIDEGITLGDLKGTLEFFARSMFGPERSTRIRPHHFRFTEPSIELDVSCMVCDGLGCVTCKGSGWLEILGAGMVHPTVLCNGGIDAQKYTGFAFGMGIERVAQLAYGIDDGRLFYENNIRFLRQS